MSASGGHRTTGACLSQGRPRAASRRWRSRWRERLGGVVINADSMQVYRDLRILTARPTPEEEARVPHRLYGHVDAAVNYSVGRWCAMPARRWPRSRAAGRAADLRRRHRPLFQGADAGLAAVPPIPAEVRDGGARRLAARGRRGAACRTGARDPATARRLMPARPRPHRARAGGPRGDRPLARRLAPRRHARRCSTRERASSVFLAPDRDELYRADRCALRRDAGGRRARRGRARWPRRELDPAAAGHEGAWRAVADPPPRRRDRRCDEAAEAAKRDTRHYAKRQVTWFRHQLPDWTWVAPDMALGEIAARASGR